MIIYIYLILSDVITVYSWILIVYALMSWIPGLQRSGFGRLVDRIVWPYLSIFARIPTRFGIFDFKVILGLIMLQVIQQFLNIVFLR